VPGTPVLAHPPPCSHLPEIQRHLRPPRLPAGCTSGGRHSCGGRYLLASTDTFSSEHTRWVFDRFYGWLVPSLTEDQFSTIHHFVRKKSAHVTEYLCFPATSIAACAVIAKGGAGRGALGTLLRRRIFRPG